LSTDYNEERAAVEEELYNAIWVWKV